MRLKPSFLTLFPAALLAALALPGLAAHAGAPPAAPSATTARHTAPARSADPDDAPHVSDADDIEPDAPENEQKFNREIWETIRRTPYADALRYVARAQKAEKARHDARPDADTLTLPTGWKIAPAGTQVEVGRFPYEAVAFAGKVVVLNTGYYKGTELPEVSVVDPQGNRVTQTLRFEGLFPSATIGADGDLYISGGFARKVYRLGRDFRTVRTYSTGNGYAGAIAPLDAAHVAVSYLVSAATPEAFQKGDVQPGRIAILNTVTGAIEKEAPAGYYPFSLHVAAGKIYAALLGENKLLVFDRGLNLLKTLDTGATPEAIGAETSGPNPRLWVINANSDNMSVVDTRTDTLTTATGLRENGTQFGGAPTSCALDDRRLFVTLTDVNAVAVLDRKTGRFLGYIPTGWYPTKVLVDQRRLFILSAKGIHARRPNPNDATGHHTYVLNLLKGSLASVPLADIAAHLPAWTRQVQSASPIRGAAAAGGVVSGAALPPIRHVFYIVRENRTYDQVMGDLPKANGDANLVVFGRDTTPNAHRLAEQFVTLDNYFTDAEISVLGHSFTTSGYASPFLEWIGEADYAGKYKGYVFGSVPAVTSPAYLWDACDAAHVDYRVYGENYYLYTRGYALLKNAFGADSPICRKFYAQMFVLAQKVDRGNAFFHFASAYYGKMATPDAAKALLRDDTAFTGQLSLFLCGDDSLADALRDHPDLRRGFAEYLYRYPANYRSWDLSYSDLDRFAAWKTDFEEQVRTNHIAALQYLWLPNDHTAGATSTTMPPDTLVAQNDAALARIIQTIAASPVWKDSLILVTEDDAQDGPDHVDATRTVALAVGPYVRRGAVIHDRYDQLSLLRTIERLLGLPPLNRNDALAVPMFSLFTEKPDLTPPAAPVPSSHLSPADRERFDRKAPAPAATTAAGDDSVQASQKPPVIK